MKKNSCVRCAFLCASMAACAGSASAAITATGGDATLVSPPASTVLGATESNTVAWAFNEAVTYTLTAPLDVDVTTPGLYTSAASLTPGVLPIGTVVNSHYLYSDPVANASNTYEGTVDFDAPVIGIIVLRRNLNASDYLGASGTLYGDNSARGLEVSVSSDTFRLSVSGTRVSFRFETSGATDDIRVLTIPTPGALSLAGVVLAGLTRRRR
jgi:uncharacterized protein (TIGR03382 family)